jgi:hypothetical protein
LRSLRSFAANEFLAFVQVSRQRLLGGVPDGLWFQDARRLALPLLDKLMPHFVGNLFILHAERFPLVHRHIAQAIAQIIRPRFVKFSTPAEMPFFNSKDHAAPFIMICSISRNRNRTAPRILTAVNVPNVES